MKHVKAVFNDLPNDILLMILKRGIIPLKVVLM